MSLNFFDQNILNYSQNPIQLFYHKIYNNNLTDITFRHSNRRFRVIANDFPTHPKTFPDQTKKIQQKKTSAQKPENISEKSTRSKAKKETFASMHKERPRPSDTLYGFSEGIIGLPGAPLSLRQYLRPKSSPGNNTAFCVSLRFILTALD